MKKTVFPLILTITLALFGCTNEDQSIYPKETALNQTYNLITINYKQIPKGVTPLAFNNYREAEEFLLVEKQNIANFEASNKKQTKQNNNYAIIGPSSCGKEMNGSYPQSASAGWFTSYNSRTYYTYCDTNRNFRSVTNITSNLSGLSTGVTYTQVGYGANVSPTFINYNINGILDYYLIISGTIKIWTENITLTGGFENTTIGSGGGGGGLGGIRQE